MMIHDFGCAKELPHFFVQKWKKFQADADEFQIEWSKKIIIVFSL